MLHDAAQTDWVMNRLWGNFSPSLFPSLHRLSKPITQMFCTVIRRNDSSLYLLQSELGLFRGGKRTRTRSCSWALRVGVELQSGCAQFLLCIPAVKSVNPENSWKLLGGFEHHRKFWKQLSCLLPCFHTSPCSVCDNHRQGQARALLCSPLNTTNRFTGARSVFMFVLCSRLLVKGSEELQHLHRNRWNTAVK